jgi:hypothetical protein
VHPLFCDSLNGSAYIVSKELNLDPDSFVLREIPSQAKYYSVLPSLVCVTFVIYAGLLLS